MNFLKRINIYYLKLIAIATIVAVTVVAFGAYIISFSFPNMPKQSTLFAPPADLVSPQPTLSSSVVQPPVKANSDWGQKQAISSQLAYGHFPYTQADMNTRMIIASYATKEYQRFESLASEAGKALMKMIYAARDEGVWIIPVSGFRTIEQQQKLFQEQIKRRGSAEAAAKVSAPAGYSEHHTGFAVDLADGHFPKQDITYQFENTTAYHWLTRHAKEFGFEISFPPNNVQGVSFEPWHWRYVGSPDAAKIFAKARNLR